ncbi:MAG: Transcriptional regulator, LysR family [uncultured Rubrobacteraceae bacterium]|uniref:Transcriptional regulator, LysR family n=1 Tax=uncultured Rubrobacteraceae bacterium TaxID=349277 RepID=A0A6J4R4I1_9ACTN|nr:MAG: Transcriptional regulator, LysR family [uncultured Rubrobacteraceae bacterium]
MELRHLRYFVAVAEDLHFRGAAERLRIAQPALSQQIRKLEDDLGVKLFDRSGRRVRLTPAGSAFLEGARATLGQAEGARRAAVRADRGEVGRLSLGFTGSAAHEVLPRLVRAFREDRPDVELELRSLYTPQQVRALEEGRIDAGLLRSPPVHDLLEVLPVSREALLAVLPEDHPLASEERVPLAALADEGFVLPPRRLSPAIHDRVIGLCRQAGFSPRVVQESAESESDSAALQSIAGMVASGLGVSLTVNIPESLNNPGAVCRPVYGPEAGWDLVLAWRRDEGSPVVRAFVEVAERMVDPPA